MVTLGLFREVDLSAILDENYWMKKKFKRIVGFGALFLILSVGCRPTPPVEPAKALGELQKMIEDLGYTPLILPVGVEVFDVGRYFRDEVRQTYGGNVASTCGLDPNGLVREGAGPKELDYLRESKLSVGVKAGIDFSQFGVPIEVGGGVKKTKTASASIKFSDLWVRSLLTDKIDAAASGEDCRKKLDEKPVVVGEVLIGRPAVDFKDTRGRSINADVQALGIIKASPSVNIEMVGEDGLKAEKPLVLGYKTVNVQVFDNIFVDRQGQTMSAGGSSYDLKRVTVMGGKGDKRRSHPKGVLRSYRMWIEVPDDMARYIEHVEWDLFHPSMAGRKPYISQGLPKFRYIDEQYGCISPARLTIVFKKGAPGLKAHRWQCRFNQCRLLGVRSSVLPESVPVLADLPDCAQAP